MSTILSAQLQQLYKQQEELKKQIQEEAETKKKLNNEASIERLEALVQPITDTLDHVQYPHNKDHNVVSSRIRWNEGLKVEALKYNSALNIAITNNNRPWPPPLRKNRDLENEEIYITLIGIIKKQDERIKKLEELVSQHWFHIHENSEYHNTLSK